MPPSLRPCSWIGQVSFSLPLSWKEVFSFPLSQPEPRQEVEVLLSAPFPQALRGGPGLAHPEGPGLDHDPDLALALPLIRGADQALLGDPGLVLQPGALANLEHHLKNKVALLLKAPAEARAQNETTEDPSAIFSFFLIFLSIIVCKSV
ncbi:hypothetical protein PHYPO_G00022330 [Pangasianodon hypophthalmus]|uniref:Uncharacterized protein n=1 Tax=Pangasianodon hypophthalmus TaxID=310915 RepID=A0A5N5MUY6_PANHP|nr:hypothetical protein PHYPO_G00022330 [Pangasianodon hypophthalmus]